MQLELTEAYCKSIKVQRTTSRKYVLDPISKMIRYDLQIKNDCKNLEIMVNP